MTSALAVAIAIIIGLLALLASIGMRTIARRGFQWHDLDTQRAQWARQQPQQGKAGQ